MSLSFSCSSPEAESVFVTARKGSLHLLQGWPQPSLSIPTGRLKLGGSRYNRAHVPYCGGSDPASVPYFDLQRAFSPFYLPLWHYTFYGTTVYKHGSQEASILTKALPVFSRGLSVSFSFLLSVVIIFLSLYCSIKVYKSSRVKSFSWLMVHYLWMAAIYFVWFLLRKRKKQNKTCACRILFLLSYLLFWNQIICLQKKDRKKHSFLVSFSKIQLRMLTFHLTFRSSEVPSPVNDNTRLEISLHSVHQSLCSSAQSSCRDSCHLPLPSTSTLALGCGNLNGFCSSPVSVHSVCVCRPTPRGPSFPSILLPAHNLLCRMLYPHSLFGYSGLLSDLFPRQFSSLSRDVCIDWFCPPRIDLREPTKVEMETIPGCTHFSHLCAQHLHKWHLHVVTPSHTAKPSPEGWKWPNLAAPNR